MLNETEMKMLSSLQPPVLITGCPRSGTSMTAGILRCCGAYAGKVNEAFENEEINQTVFDPYLRFIGCDPKMLWPLPVYQNMKPLAGLIRRIETNIKFQGYRHGAWLLKSSRIAVLWPLWMQNFPNAKWVIVRRKDDHIINSCMKTGYMREHKTAAGWQMWVDAYKKRFDDIHLARAYVREVWPSRFINGDLSEVQDVVRWLGLKWNGEAVHNFIKPAMWRDELWQE